MSEVTLPRIAITDGRNPEFSIDVETLIARVVGSIKQARASQYKAEEQVVADIRAIVARLKCSSGDAAMPSGL